MAENKYIGMFDIQFIIHQLEVVMNGLFIISLLSYTCVANITDYLRKYGYLNENGNGMTNLEEVCKFSGIQ